MINIPQVGVFCSEIAKTLHSEVLYLGHDDHPHLALHQLGQLYCLLSCLPRELTLPPAWPAVLSPAAVSEGLSCLGRLAVKTSFILNLSK